MPNHTQRFSARVKGLFGLSENESPSALAVLGKSSS